MLITVDTPRKGMVNKENYYQDHKGHSYKMANPAKENFFSMTLLYTHTQYIYTVYAKYQIAFS